MSRMSPVQMELRIDERLPNVSKRLSCAAEGCTKTANFVWQNEGKLAEKQLCKEHYDTEYSKAIIEEARKLRYSKKTDQK